MFIKINNNINKFIFLILLVLVIFSYCQPLLLAQSVKIQGLIRKVDFEKKALLVDESWYFLSPDTAIYKNNYPVSLVACIPPGDNVFFWAELTIGNKGKIRKIDLYYRVIEGIITDISASQRWLKLKIFNQEPYFLEKNKKRMKFNWNEKLTFGSELLKGKKEGEHIILVVAKDMILKVIGGENNST